MQSWISQTNKNQFYVSNNSWQYLCIPYVRVYKHCWSCVFFSGNMASSNLLCTLTQISLLTQLHIAWSMPSCMNDLPSWIYALPLANLRSAKHTMWIKNWIQEKGCNVLVSFLVTTSGTVFCRLNNFLFVTYGMHDFLLPTVVFFIFIFQNVGSSVNNVTRPQQIYLSSFMPNKHINLLK